MFRKIALVFVGLAIWLAGMAGCASDRPRGAASSSDAGPAGAAHAPCH